LCLRRFSLRSASVWFCGACAQGEIGS
jgi:hypothetical protein